MSWVCITMLCVVTLICSINAIICSIVLMVFCISSACSSMSFMRSCKCERFIFWNVPPRLS